MTLRTIKLSAVVMVLCVLFLAPGVAPPTNARPFYYYWVGCWKATPTSLCRDVFGYSGNTTTLWVCYPCGRMVTPQEHSCIPYNPSTLFETGEWCD